MDAKITAFASGKGGSGKSTVSLLVGAALAEIGQKVIIIELACFMRSLDVPAQVSEMVVFDLNDVLCGKVGPGRAVVQSPVYPNLSLLLAPYLGGKISHDSLGALCERLSHFYEHIIFDVCIDLPNIPASFCSLFHRVVLVQTPDAISLRSGRLLSDHLQQVHPNMRLILNRVSLRHVLQESGLEDLDEAIDTVGAQLLGVVPESPHIKSVLSLGKRLPHGCEEQDVFCAIARRMLGEDVPLIIK